MRKHIFLLMPALALLTVLSACGGGGDGAGGGPAVATDLHAVFYRTLTNAPVQTITLKRQNGNPLPDSTITFDTRVDSTGNRLAGAVTSQQTDIANGNADFALPAGTYPIVISAPNTTVAVGGLNDTVTVSGSSAKLYQTSQQNWNVSSNTAFTRLNVDIYQTDAAGNVNFGTLIRPLNPLVLSTSITTTLGTSAQFTTELFQGTYRAVVTAGTQTVFGTIPPYITPASSVMAVPGGGSTDTMPTIDFLQVAANILTLTLFDDATPISSTTALYSVDVFDRASTLLIGSATNNAQGVASIPTGNTTDVVAVVTRITNTALGTGSVEAIKPYTVSAGFVVELHKYPVPGNVIPPGGGTLDSADTTMQVVAKINSGLGDFFDKVVADPIVGSVNPLGVISPVFKLFEGTYTLAASIRKFPDSDKLPLTVSGGAPASQTINVRAGGIITGRVQDQANNDLVGVSISITDAATNDLVSLTTSATQGVYSLAVPFGTYNLFADGALTRNIVVNTGTVTRDLRRFTVQGRITDSAGSGLAGTVRASSGDASVTASALGTFTVNLMEGENWVLFSPPADQPSLGASLEPAVQIDASTITTN